jgi:hypothetical protein
MIMSASERTQNRQGWQPKISKSKTFLICTNYNICGGKMLLKMLRTSRHHDITTSAMHPHALLLPKKWVDLNHFCAK